jgi:hypothetical protein
LKPGKLYPNGISFIASPVPRPRTTLPGYSWLRVEKPCAMRLGLYRPSGELTAVPNERPGIWAAAEAIHVHAKPADAPVWTQG